MFTCFLGSCVITLTRKVSRNVSGNALPSLVLTPQEDPPLGPYLDGWWGVPDPPSAEAGQMAGGYWGGGVIFVWLIAAPLPRKQYPQLLIM